MAKKEPDLLDDIVSAGIEICGVLIIAMVDLTFAVAAAFIIGACWLFMADD